MVSEKILSDMLKKLGISPLRFRRALLHILTGSAILFLAINWYDYVKWFLFFLLIIGLFISLLSLRMRLPFIYFMLKKFEVPRYLRSFPGKGALFLIAGCLLVLKLFPYSIALASIAIITYADPAAYLFGVAFGRIKYRKPFNRLKKIEGSIFGIIIGWLAASFFVQWFAALLAAGFAMVAEALVLKLGGDNVDDNFVVPLTAATTLYLLSKVLIF
jgi:dolichol kinase